MKKFLKVFLIVVIAVFVLVVIDLIAIFNINRPLFAIKGNDDKYSGIFYDTYNCKEFSVPQIKSKFTKYSCTSKNNAKKIIKEIVDKTKTMKDFMCAQALESFYTDEESVYYYSCIKSEYIVVIYEDGSEETVKKALAAKRIEITDLDDYDITYYKYPKQD